MNLQQTAPEVREGRPVSGCSLGMRVVLPDRLRPGIRLRCSVSILSKAVEFPEACHSPAAIAECHAKLYDDPDRTGDASAGLWLTHEVSTFREGGTISGAGLIVGLDITTRAGNPCPLLCDIGEIWNELHLGSILPCPKEGPLAYGQYDGRVQQLRALAEFLFA